jgi:hypothetical protein
MPLKAHGQLTSLHIMHTAIPSPLPKCLSVEIERNRQQTEERNE